MYSMVVVKNTTAHRRSYRVRDPRTDRGPLASAETIDESSDTAKVLSEYFRQLTMRCSFA